MNSLPEDGDVMGFLRNRKDWKTGKKMSVKFNKQMIKLHYVVNLEWFFASR